jgi:CelD/BcsL family acetyltransferase involved in cellulose biosynthesis
VQTYAPDPSIAADRNLHLVDVPASQEVGVVESGEALPDLEAAWRRLEADSPAGVFASWEWASTIARHQARSRRLHVALATRDGEPVGLAPLAYRRFLGIRTLVLLSGGLAEYPIADYQDVLLRPGHEQDALAALADEVAKAPWDLLWLQELPADSPTTRLLPEIAREHGWRVVAGPASDVHRVDLPASWEDYVGGLSSSWRKEIRSKLRRLEGDHGARFRLVEHAEDIDDAMETLFDLHTRRWQAVGQPGIFASEQSRAFYRDLAHTMHEAGELYLGVLRTAEGEAIGAGFGFDHGGTRYAYTYGYQPGREWEKASLGLMLDCFCIRTAIESGLQRVDLMRSEGEYKKRYGAVSADNVEVMVFRTHSAYLRVMAYRRLRSTAKRLLKKGH